MKSEKLIRALGKISDELILEVYPKKTRLKRSFWPVLCAAAVVAFCFWAIPRFMGVVPIDPTISEPSITIPQPVTETPSEASPKPEAEKAPAKTPIISIGTNHPAAYREDYLLTDEELVLPGLSDFSNLPKQLPVYKNGRRTDYYGRLPEEEAVFDAEYAFTWAEEILTFLDIAADLTINGDQVECSNKETGDVFLKIHSDYSAEIVGIYYPMTEEEAVEIAAKALDIREPAQIPVPVTPGLEAIQIYDTSGDPGQWLSRQAFMQAQIISADGFVFSVTIKKDEPELIDYYPIITAEQATEALLDGIGMTTFDDTSKWSDLEIVSCSLTYLGYSWFDCHIPFYRFLVTVPELEENQIMEEGYGAYTCLYVPAVEFEYLDSVPRWKTEPVEPEPQEPVQGELEYPDEDPQKTEIYRAIHQADWVHNSISEETKSKIYEFVTSDISLMTSVPPLIGGYWTVTGDGRQDHLTCRTPVLQWPHSSQIYTYDYMAGEVLYGPTGSPGEWTLSEEIIRTMNSEYIHDGSMRSLFAKYYFDNWQELQYLDLECPAAPEQEDRIYYRLRSLRQMEEGSCTMTFEGFLLPSTDFQAGQERSETYRKILDNYPWQTYEDKDREAIAQTMQRELTLEEQGIPVCEILEITVSLQEGEQPFRYLSSHRSKPEG